MTTEIEAYSVLEDVATRLCADLPALPNTDPDGRINSGNNEKIIIDDVERIISSPEFSRGRNISFLRGKPRAWYDLALNLTLGGKTYFAPVNVKISNLSGADNISAKLGIYYALTGQKPVCAPGISWPDFFHLLDRNIGSGPDSDYYFLIVKKHEDDGPRVFAQSLRRLRKIVPNGNNAPFQCQWADNTVSVPYRNLEAAERFLIRDGIHASLKKRAAALDSCETYMKKRRDPDV